jgi:hypothetical protein
MEGARKGKVSRRCKIVDLVCHKKLFTPRPVIVFIEEGILSLAK